MLKIKDEIFREQFAALGELVKDDPTECGMGLSLHADGEIPLDGDPTLWLKTGPFCDWVVWLKFDMPVGDMRFEARIPIGMLSRGVEKALEAMNAFGFMVTT